MYYLQYARLYRCHSSLTGRLSRLHAHACVQVLSAEQWAMYRSQGVDRTYSNLTVAPSIKVDMCE